MSIYFGEPFGATLIFNGIERRVAFHVLGEERLLQVKLEGRVRQLKIPYGINCEFDEDELSIHWVDNGEISVKFCEMFDYLQVQQFFKKQIPEPETGLQESYGNVVLNVLNHFDGMLQSQIREILKPDPKVVEKRQPQRQRPTGPTTATTSTTNNLPKRVKVEIKQEPEWTY